MKRTTKSSDVPKPLMYPIEEEPIVLSKPLLDTFLSKPNPADLIALYCFYYHTAKWQKTNQPKATNNYCMQGLGWGYQKLYRTQKQLIELKLIEKLNTRDALGKISGWYIKVNFIWKKDTIQNYQNQELVKPRTGKQKTNALSSNNKNALSNNKKKDFEKFIDIFPQDWLAGSSFSFETILNEFVSHRKQIHRPLTPLASKRLATKLTKYDIETAIKALEASIENSWTGVFPESVKQSPSNNKSNYLHPRKIIQNYFTKDKLYGKTFYKEYYLDAEALLSDKSNGQCSQLAEDMIELYRWIKINRAKEVKGVSTPGPLICNYIQWLERQDWVEVEPRTFLPQNHLFQKKFLPKESSEAGVHVITGKYFK